MPGPHRVVLVLDAGCGERLIPLASAAHVWAVDSPANRLAAEAVWAAPCTEYPWAGVTTFHAPDRASTVATCDDMLATIEEHHGPYSHHPPWSEVEIVGVPAEEADGVRHCLLEYGFTFVEQSGPILRAQKEASAT